MPKRLLQLQQLNAKISASQSLGKVVSPPTGWIKAIRVALNMSMQQLGTKLGKTKQSIMEMEEREKDGNITINTLREAGKAMDMQLVYGFVPNDGTLDALIERKALELANKIVMRTSANMRLENQENKPARLKKAIEERAETIKNEMPKVLWD